MSHANVTRLRKRNPAIAAAKSGISRANAQTLVLAEVEGE